jgi:mono/diheme cytochrome c family protein
MTMVSRVKDPAFLTQVDPGDMTVERIDGALTIVALPRVPCAARHGREDSVLHCALPANSGEHCVMKKVIWIAVMMGVAGVVALGWAYSGQYNVAADAPHWGLTTRMLATIRDRSIEARAADLTVPDLADPALIALGAEHYAGMCTGCHLAPGVGDNEMRQGLYPQPPNLSERRDRSPAQSFWIVKHGLKMSGMPAWGVTHDDEAIWGLVAFLQQLPTMDATAYKALTDDASVANHDHNAHEHGEHERDDGETEQGGDASVPPASAIMGESAEAGHTHVHPDGEEHDH